MRELEGVRVRLLPMERSHAEALFEAGNDPEIWRYLPLKVEKPEDMARIVDGALKAKATGMEFPFVVYDKELNAIVGSTRLLGIMPAHRNFEIGWTWYHPKVWRTRVNTECKYLLLRWGFEEFRAVRIQLKTDVRNERSNRAIRRLGAVHEGVQRQDRILHDGHIRNANLYSIIDKEWPEVKKRLEGFLGGAPVSMHNLTLDCGGARFRN